MHEKLAGGDVIYHAYMELCNMGLRLFPVFE